MDDPANGAGENLAECVQKGDLCTNLGIATSINNPDFVSEKEQLETEVTTRATFRRKKRNVVENVSASDCAYANAPTGVAPTIPLPEMSSAYLERLELNIQLNTLRAPPGEHSDLRENLCNKAVEILSSFHSKHGSVCHLPEVQWRNENPTLVSYVLEVNVEADASGSIADVNVRFGETKEAFELRVGTKGKGSFSTPAASALCDNGKPLKAFLNTVFPVSKNQWGEDNDELLHELRTSLKNMLNLHVEDSASPKSEWVRVGSVKVDNSNAWDTAKKHTVVSKTREALDTSSLLHATVTDEGIEFTLMADMASADTGWALMGEETDDDVQRVELSKFGLAACPPVLKDTTVEIDEDATKALIMGMMTEAFKLKMVVQWRLTDLRYGDRKYCEARAELTTGKVLKSMIKSARLAGIALAFPQSEKRREDHGYMAAQAIYGIVNAIWVACEALESELEDESAITNATTKVHDKSQLLVGLLDMTECIFGVHVCKTNVSDIVASSVDAVMNDVLALWLVPMSNKLTDPPVVDEDAYTNVSENSHWNRTAALGRANEHRAASLRTQAQSTNADWAGLNGGSSWQDFQEMQAMIDKSVLNLCDLQRDICARAIHVHGDKPLLNEHVHRGFSECAKEIMLVILHVSAGITLAERNTHMGTLRDSYKETNGIQTSLLDALKHAQEAYCLLLHSNRVTDALGEMLRLQGSDVASQKMSNNVQTLLQQTMAHLQHASHRVFPRVYEEAALQHTELQRLALAPLNVRPTHSMSCQLYSHRSSKGLSLGGMEAPTVRKAGRSAFDKDTQNLQSQMKKEIALRSEDAVGVPKVAKTLLAQPNGTTRAKKLAMSKSVVEIVVGAIETVRKEGIRVKSVGVQFDQDELYTWDNLVFQALKSMYKNEDGIVEGCREFVCQQELAVPQELFGERSPARAYLWLAVAKPIVEHRLRKQSIDPTVDNGSIALAAIVICNAAMGIVNTVLGSDVGHVVDALASSDAERVSGTLTASSCAHAVKTFHSSDVVSICISPEACLREPYSARSGFCAETAETAVDLRVQEQCKGVYATGLSINGRINVNEGLRDCVQLNMVKQAAVPQHSNLWEFSVDAARSLGVLHLEVLGAYKFTIDSSGKFTPTNVKRPDENCSFVVMRASNEKRAPLKTSMEAVAEIVKNTMYLNELPNSVLKKGVLPLNAQLDRELVVVMAGCLTALGVTILSNETAVVRANMLDAFDEALTLRKYTLNNEEAVDKENKTRVNSVQHEDDPLHSTEVQDVSRTMTNAVIGVEDDGSHSDNKSDKVAFEGAMLRMNVERGMFEFGHNRTKVEDHIAAEGLEEAPKLSFSAALLSNALLSKQRNYVKNAISIARLASVLNEIRENEFHKEHRTSVLQNWSEYKVFTRLAVSVLGNGYVLGGSDGGKSVLQSLNRTGKLIGSVVFSLAANQAMSTIEEDFDAQMLPKRSAKIYGTNLQRIVHYGMGNSNYNETNLSEALQSAVNASIGVQISASKVEFVGFKLLMSTLTTDTKAEMKAKGISEQSIVHSRTHQQSIGQAKINEVLNLIMYNAVAETSSDPQNAGLVASEGYEETKTGFSMRKMMHNPHIQQAFVMSALTGVGDPITCSRSGYALSNLVSANNHTRMEQKHVDVNFVQRVIFNTMKGMLSAGLGKSTLGSTSYAHTNSALKMCTYDGTPAFIETLIIAPLRAPSDKNERLFAQGKSSQSKLFVNALANGTVNPSSCIEKGDALDLSSHAFHSSVAVIAQGVLGENASSILSVV